MPLTLHRALSAAILFLGGRSNVRHSALVAYLSSDDSLVPFPGDSKMTWNDEAEMRRLRYIKGELESELMCG